ncbi:MAG: putative transaldolase [Acetothermia bacterium 64_32]|nr:MAG: putative transaldolase [Acetothermia bacterium 64_32]HAF69886.1 fructose-6-phosphate aldolase [Candidatus Acetothermia bacterium]
MNIFLDTASLEEIREFADLIDGVTTNPTLVAREGRPFRELVAEICRLVRGPVSAEVTALDVEGMVAQARDLAKIADNVVIKIPMGRAGVRAVRKLSAEGIATNVTLVFSPVQALWAAKAGATYVSPFVGRIDDRAGDGMEIVAQILRIYENYRYDTQLIVASIRHVRHVVEAALLGAPIATMPYKVVRELFDHPLTDLGIERFLSDWKGVPQG